MKTMNKEDHNNFIILMLELNLWYVPHIFLTLIHNLVKEGKEGQIYLQCCQTTHNGHIFYQPHEINQTLNWAGLHIWYSRGQPSYLHLEPMYLLPWSGHCHVCQQCQIVLPATQASHRCDCCLLICLRQTLLPTMWPNVWLQLKPSAANWEPIWCLAEQLVTALFNNISLKEMHKHHLNKLKWDDRLWNCEKQQFMPFSGNSLLSGVFQSDRSMQPITTSLLMIMSNETSTTNTKYNKPLQPASRQSALQVRPHQVTGPSLIWQTWGYDHQLCIAHPWTHH